MKDTENQPKIDTGVAAMSRLDFCKFAGIGSTTYYKLVSQGDITPRLINKKPVILVSEAKAWLNSLPVAAA